MNETQSPAASAWTCPFCSLLCDAFQPDAPQPTRLIGTDCPRAHAGLAAHRSGPVSSDPLVDGRPSGFDESIETAAGRLSTWRQPLFGGLGTDVAGARMLYRLAARTSAICDHAEGPALMHGVRAVQDRGQFYTTLGEVSTRADLIVCIGTKAIAHYPEFFRRCGLGQPGSPCRSLVFFGVQPPTAVPPNVEVHTLIGSGDLFTDLQQLCALVDGRRMSAPEAAFVTLAEQLRTARYAVLVWEAGVLPAHGALLVEALNRIVASLNLTTRAATFSLGGSDGAYTVNNVFTWLSGLPLRTRIQSSSLQHEPLCFDTERLLFDHAVDGLLWVSSFDPMRLPPATDLPCIVLGPPAMTTRLRESGRLDRCIFLPVATPGLNATGHLFRTDGGIVVPLVPAGATSLPTVAEVLTRIDQKLPATTTREAP
jgi:formylmethanofuran dehydrogenase subunit B